MLDDGDGRPAAGKFAHQFQRRIGIVVVVVGQLLALHLPRLRHAGRGRAARDIDRRRLVRVLAIAQLVPAGEGHRQRLGELRRLQRLCPQRVRKGIGEGEPAGDGGVIGCGASIGLARHAHAERKAGAACVAHLGQQFVVIGRVCQDGHEIVVLGRGTDHGRAADIDVLDDLLTRAAARHGLLKGIEVDHKQVDRADRMGLHRRHVLGIVAHSQQAAVNQRVERLDPAVHHLGKAGDLRNVLHRQAGIADRLCRAAGRDQLHAHARKGRSQFDNTALVGHRKECPPDRHRAHRCAIPFSSAASRNCRRRAIPGPGSRVVPLHGADRRRQPKGFPRSRGCLPR